MNEYVEEICKEKRESVHHEETATGHGTGAVATKHKGQPIPQSYPVSTIFMTIDQRMWNDIPAFDYVS